MSDIVERLRGWANSMDCLDTDLLALEAATEIERLTRWVHDCQAGMYINCVYCGHRYGPDDEIESTMQQALYDHIAQCPKHPLSKAIAERDEAREAARWLWKRHVVRKDEIGYLEHLTWLEQEE